MIPALGSSRRLGSVRSERGATLAAVIVLVAIMSILAAAAAEWWSFIRQRENEQELIYRGRNIMTAIDEFQARNQRLPSKLEDLTKLPNPTLRQVWADPLTARYDSDGELIEGTGEWELLTPERGRPSTGGNSARRNRRNTRRQGITGVASKSEDLTIAIWDDVPPASPYTEWRFEITHVSTVTANREGTAFQAGQRTRVLEDLRPPGFGGTERAPGDPPPGPAPRFGTARTGRSRGR